MAKQGEATTIMGALGIKQGRTHLTWPEAVVVLGLAGMFFWDGGVHGVVVAGMNVGARLMLCIDWELIGEILLGVAVLFFGVSWALLAMYWVEKGKK